MLLAFYAALFCCELRYGRKVRPENVRDPVRYPLPALEPNAPAAAPAATFGYGGSSAAAATAVTGASGGAVEMTDAAPATIGGAADADVNPVGTRDASFNVVDDDDDENE